MGQRRLTPEEHKRRRASHERWLKKRRQERREKAKENKNRERIDAQFIPRCCDLYTCDGRPG
jgi:hypothetical protein